MCDADTPPAQEMKIVFLDEQALQQIEQWLSACEHCCDWALMALDYVLDAFTGSDPASTEYVMCRPARCLSCRSEVTEKTRVAV